MILSTKYTTLNGQSIIAVLTIGRYAAETGNFTNDVAVYYSDFLTTENLVARQGQKASYAQALSIGFRIAEENYRL